MLGASPLVDALVELPADCIAAVGIVGLPVDRPAVAAVVRSGLAVRIR